MIVRNDPIARDLVLTLDRRTRRRVRELDGLRNRFGIGKKTETKRIRLQITALAADLLAWTQRLALTGPAASYEPKRLRLRILTVAGRLIRTARRTPLKIPQTWPCATEITTTHARLATLTP